MDTTDNCLWVVNGLVGTAVRENRVDRRLGRPPKPPLENERPKQTDAVRYGCASFRVVKNHFSEPSSDRTWDWVVPDCGPVFPVPLLEVWAIPMGSVEENCNFSANRSDVVPHRWRATEAPNFRNNAPGRFGD